MKVKVNSYIKRNTSEEFISGQVLFESIVTNGESKNIPDQLIVNLSKSGNPQCDTALKHLQGHNSHAGTFNSYAAMREYVRRVTSDITEVVRTHNMEQEEIDANPTTLDYATIEQNEDLVPLPIDGQLPTGLSMMSVTDLIDMAKLHDFLLDIMEDECDPEEDDE
jgi:hypothetical protein